MLLKRFTQNHRKKVVAIYHRHKAKDSGFVSTSDTLHYMLNETFHEPLRGDERKEFYFKGFEQGYTGYHYYLNDSIARQTVCDTSDTDID